MLLLLVGPALLGVLGALAESRLLICCWSNLQAATARW
jgi:hypothetical protein